MRWQRGQAYSQDLRERVLAAADEGLPVGQIAVRFRVSVSDVSKVLSRRQRTGGTTALAQRGHLLPKLAALHEAIRRQVTARPDATLAELCTWLLQTHQVSASSGLMWKTLDALELTYKKSRFGRRSRTARTSLRSAASGVGRSQVCPRASSFSLMNPRPRRI